MPYAILGVRHVVRIGYDIHMVRFKTIYDVSPATG
jgi:hypothetical protein